MQTLDGAIQHAVLFYDAESFLVDSVASYVRPALKTGRLAVIVATAEHTTGITHRLRSSGIDLAEAQAEGTLVLRDARETLARFMVGGVPQPDLFDQVVDELFEGASREGTPLVFGEMVALLVGDGLPRAALALEALWNRVQKRRHFSLLCAYPMRHFEGQALTPLALDTCIVHNLVIPAEGYSSLNSDAEREREVVLLQQKAASLEFEVAERQRLAEELHRALKSERAARDAAEAALHARDEFLSTASHELRTPMAVLGVQAQMLLRRWERTGEIEAERFGRGLQTIATQSAKLGRLVGQLLDVSRLDAGRLTLEETTTDLAELMGQVVKSAQAVSDGRRIRVRGPATLKCTIDPLRIEQVLVNLLDNAVKYSAEHDTIEVSLQASDSVARIAVRDHGPGIPLDKRDHIFERYFQVQSNGGSRRGLGLGLYLSRTIVELHGGTIVAEFPEDGGTRFVVHLPI